MNQYATVNATFWKDPNGQIRIKIEGGKPVAVPRNTTLERRLNEEIEKHEK